MSASDDAGVEVAYTGHHFVGASAGINHRAGVAIVAAQASIRARCPDNHVRGAIGASNEG